MQTLFTLTGNLLAESTAEFDMPKKGGTARARASARFQVGGKGVNVSKAAHAAGFPTAAAIFPAGFSGKRCVAFLKGKKFCRVIDTPIEGETRWGVVCVNSADNSETTFLGEDIPVPESALDSALEKISRRAKASDVLALCGSFPGWKKSFAKKISDFCAEKSLTLCIDSYGAPLESLCKTRAGLLKINRKEFFQCLADEKDDGTFECFERNFSRAAKKVRAKYFAVSDGSAPALFRVGSRIFYARPPDIGAEVSATGCGDVMFAGLIIKLFFMNSDLEGAARAAMLWAADSARSREISEMPRKRISKFLGC